MEEVNLKEVNHHKQQELCKTRPPYRQGRKLTAVKVYTVNSESQHLFVYGVTKIGLRQELKNLLLKYGEIINLHVTEGYKTEMFTECYHVHYKRIQSARIAKRVLDNRSFYGEILHVCYVPEFETCKDTKEKLLQRKRDVTKRLNNYYVKNSSKVNLEKNVLHWVENKSIVKQKRKSDIHIDDPHILKKFASASSQ